MSRLPRATQLVPLAFESLGRSGRSSEGKFNE